MSNKFDIKSKKHQRFAYVKNGDVVAEVSSISIDDERNLRNAGPNYYTGSFMKWTSGSCSIFISRHTSDKKYFNKNMCITARVFNTLCYHKKFYKLVLEVRAFLLIFYNLLRFDPKFVLCAVEGGGPLFACYIICKLLKIQFVHTRHMRLDLYSPSLIKKIKMKIDHWIIRHAKTVICNGPYLEDQLIKIGVKKEKIIQFGLPYLDLQAPPPTLSPEDQFVIFHGITILYVGRIEEKKGVFDLFDATHQILLNENNVRLFFVGEGKSLNKLKQKAKLFGIGDKVFFTGHVPHNDVIHIMRHSDILVIPTRQELGEGRCKSAIEGLILGLPIIAPNYGAFRYLIKDNYNGLFYEPDNIDDLKLKIYMLVKSAKERQLLSSNAKNDGRKLVNPERTFFDALGLAFRS